MSDSKPSNAKPSDTNPSDTKSNGQREQEWAEQDDEVRRITDTVLPKQDAPPRAGITESGSGADGQGT